MTLQPADYTDLREHLEGRERVKNVTLERRRVDASRVTDLYISLDVQPAGINLWELHDKFDFDIVSSWHDPTTEMLSMAFRLRE